MKSLAAAHHAWLTDPARTALFACRESGRDCALYHVLAPVLHDAGMWRSFEAYRTILAEMFAQILLRQEALDVLIAGINSEASARTLAAVAGLFAPRVRLTFADICATPMKRIRAALEPTDPPIETVFGDLVGSVPALAGKTFDVVLADGFLAQFPPAHRPGVLSALRGQLRPSHGTMVVREYFGDLDVLLARDRFPAAPVAGVDRMAPVRPMLDTLHRQLTGSWRLYAQPAALVGDAAQAGLEPVMHYVSPAHSDRVYLLCTRPASPGHDRHGLRAASTR